MKRKRYENKLENRILTAMIVDDVVAKRVAPHWQAGGLFRSSWANLIGGWVCKYTNEYKTAPRDDVEGLFDDWAESRSADEDMAENVENFLSGISGAYEEEAEGINPEYMVDRAGVFFNRVVRERATRESEAAAEAGDHERAEIILDSWTRVELGEGSAYNFLSGDGSIADDLEEEAEPLIKYPGALGRFFGNQLARDEFVAFTGVSGRGKTWWLLDVAWRGMTSHNRVAFFSVGDMTERQVKRRLWVRAAQHPRRPGRVSIPVSMDAEDVRSSDTGLPEVEYDEREFKNPLTEGRVLKGLKRINRRHPEDALKISTHPAGSLSVGGIEAVLSNWESMDGWVPDVVVVDYADILAPPAGMPPGERNSINETWKQLRALSQRRYCLVVTATQADAGAYDSDIMRQGNFSEDRRKNDHVTAMCGINSTPAEKAMGVCRLNWTKRRESPFSETTCVHVAGCLAVGAVAMVSAFETRSEDE